MDPDAVDRVTFRRMEGALIAGRIPRSAAVAALTILAACSSAPRPLPAVTGLPPRFPPFPPRIGAETCYFPDDDAVLAVVHVRQTHLPPELARDELPDPSERADLAARILAANESQRAVLGVLRDLARGGWDRVFAEGEVVGSAPMDSLSLSTDYIGTLRRIDAVLGTPAPSLVDRFVLHGTAGETDDPEWESARYAPGAALLLALSGEIRLHPAERSELVASAGRALRDGGVEAAAALSDAREDAILEEVAAVGDGPAVVVLGAAHDLADNVERWNRAHADRRIALVVLTPR